MSANGSPAGPDAERIIAERIEAARALDGTPHYRRTFSFADYLAGVNEGANPKDRVQGRLL